MPNNTYNDYGTPLSRTELYLQQIAENTSGGGGGSGGGVLVVTLDMSTGTLDKTWQEIYDSAFTVITAVEQGEKSWLSAFYAYEYDGIYEVEAFAPGQGTSLSFAADSADGYPVMQQDGGD